MTLLAFLLHQERALKKTKVRLGFLTDIDVLIMDEKGIRGRICHAIH